MSISINTIILSLLFFPICTLPSTQLIRARVRAHEPRGFYMTVLFFRISGMDDELLLDDRCYPFQGIALLRALPERRLRECVYRCYGFLLRHLFPWRFR